MMKQERTRLEYYRNLAERFLGGVHWYQCTGPAGWQTLGLDVPVYAWEIDVAHESASALLKKMPTFVHDAETALRGRVRVGYKNSVGFCIYFDERGYKKIDIVSVLARRQFAIVRGGTGSGKTTLVNHVVKAKEAETIVLYPKKFNPNKWATGVRVVGAGGDFQAIYDELERLINLMYKRDEFDKPVYIIADDWKLVTDNGKQQAARIWELVNNAREANMCVHILSQSQSVEALGIAGQGDLRESLVDVHLIEVNGRRYGTLDYGDGRKFRFDHPGLWQDAPVGASGNIELTDLQRKLVEFSYYRNNKSFSLNEKGMYRVCDLVGVSKNQLQEQAREWEQIGLLFPSKNEGGKAVPRMLTPQLIKCIKRRM